MQSNVICRTWTRSLIVLSLKWFHCGPLWWFCAHLETKMNLVSNTLQHFHVPCSRSISNAMKTGRGAPVPFLIVMWLQFSGRRIVRGGRTAMPLSSPDLTWVGGRGEGECLLPPPPVPQNLHLRCLWISWDVSVWNDADTAFRLDVCRSASGSHFEFIRVAISTLTVHHCAYLTFLLGYTFIMSLYIYWWVQCSVSVCAIFYTSDLTQVM